MMLNGWMVIQVLWPFQHHSSYQARLPVKGNEQNGCNTPLNIDPGPEQTKTWDHWFTSPSC